MAAPVLAPPTNSTKTADDDDDDNDDNDDDNGILSIIGKMIRMMMEAASKKPDGTPDAVNATATGYTAAGVPIHVRIIRIIKMPFGGADADDETDKKDAPIAANIESVKPFDSIAPATEAPAAPTTDASVPEAQSELVPASNFFSQLWN